MDYRWRPPKKPDLDIVNFDPTPKAAFVVIAYGHVVVPLQLTADQSASLKSAVEIGLLTDCGVPAVCRTASAAARWFARPRIPHTCQRTPRLEDRHTRRRNQKVET